MPRWSGLLLLVALAAGAAPTLAQPPSNAKPLMDAARFAELVRKGDQARSAGRLSEAVEAYTEALGIRQDPVVSGRLGLIVLDAGMPTDAAHLLLDAIELGRDASPAERLQWFKAFDAAQAQVCRLTVVVSHAGTFVTLDGERKNRRGNTEFYLFVTPGGHELRATLDGFEDAVEHVVAEKGGKDTVRLTLRELPAPAPAPTAEPKPGPRPTSPPRRAIAAKGATGTTGKGASGVRWSVGLGGIAVVGAPAPLPAMGFVLSASAQKDWLSLDVDARAAWSPYNIADRPIRGVTWGALIGPCAHYRWFYGCANVHLGVIQYEVTGEKGARFDSRGELTSFRAGYGVKVGAAVPLVSSLTVRVAVDAIGLPDGAVLRLERATLQERPPYMVGLSATLCASF